MIIHNMIVLYQYQIMIQVMNKNKITSMMKNTNYVTFVKKTQIIYLLMLIYIFINKI